MTRAEYAARKGRSSSWCRKSTRLAIYIRDGFRCVYCGEDLREAPPRSIGLDHLVPRSRGGSHAPSNLVTACAGCNFARQDRSWRAFATSETVVARILKLTRRTLNRDLARAILRGDVQKWEVER